MQQVSNSDTDSAGMFTKTLMLTRPAASIKSRLLVGAVALSLGAAFPAWAALGGDIASVQSDQIHMQGSLRTTVTGSYTVHEIQSAAGTVVREYVSTSGKSAGKVFAIGWQGPWPPDIRQVLGNDVAAAAANDGRESGGVMLSVCERIYVGTGADGGCGNGQRESKFSTDSGDRH